ncbi:response regulator [Paenibacillus alginolyticus]|uniref:Response regulator n=1 Tax=Paenibacillus alginolyticus TaxID=59839 RepID=A0ABT4GBP1_9BACL|nr:response regulator [Paenibacillus alginolyticus]MCY9693607.1 response regulator [Paenibacillus alginolyticus]MEC0146642.1 response regulator [Paenibacillus alginolyticus]
MKLMVVDDEPIILNGIIRMIQKANTPFIEIVGAADGFDALQKLAYFQPDLILTDIHMPEMDGLALIKEIQTLNLCSRFVILTGYGDFAYARQALRYQVIDYLLKPINKEELLTVLTKVEQTIREEQQQSIEHDLLLLKEHILYNTPIEDIPIKPEQLHSLLPDPYTTIIVFQAYEDVPLLTDERLEGIRILLEQVCKNTYTVQSRFLRQTVLIANGVIVPTDEELKRSCGELFELKRIQGNGYCIGVSVRKNDNENLRDLYIEAMAAMLFNRYFSNCNLTLYRPESETLHNDYDQLVNYIEHSLCQQISIEQIEKDIQSILPHFSGHADCNNKLREQFLICVSVYLQSVGLTPEVIWGEHAATKLFSPGNPPLENISVSEIIAQLIRYARSTDRQQPNIQAIDKIVAFVEQNYKLDLSLDAVADHVQMHPNYISMLFRKEMGLTFLHYLHTFRLAKAKRIMQENPDWPINTIAELVGYENPRHFFKVFKKFENITPGQYRLGISS